MILQVGYLSHLPFPLILRLRVRLFWLKKVSGNHFTPAYVFGKHRKLGQMEINFCVDCKITLFPRKTILGFILPLNHLHFSHTLSNLLTCTPHRHSPSSIVTELHRARHAKSRSPSPSRQFELHPQFDECRRSTHGEFPPLFEFISVRQPHITFDPPSISLRRPHLTSDPPSI